MLLAGKVKLMITCHLNQNSISTLTGGGSRCSEPREEKIQLFRHPFRVQHSLSLIPALPFSMSRHASPSHSPLATCHTFISDSYTYTYNTCSLESPYLCRLTLFHVIYDRRSRRQIKWRHEPPWSCSICIQCVLYKAQFRFGVSFNSVGNEQDTKKFL
jgi:hypothetical protein